MSEDLEKLTPASTTRSPDAELRALHRLCDADDCDFVDAVGQHHCVCPDGPECPVSALLARIAALEAALTPERIAAALLPILRANAYRGSWSSDRLHLKPLDWDNSVAANIAYALWVALLGEDAQ